MTRNVRGRTGWCQNPTGSGYPTSPISVVPGDACSRLSTWSPRRWITTLISAEESSSQVVVVFDDALQVEGLVESLTDERLDLALDDPSRPILLAVSDNGPPMVPADTRAFMIPNPISAKDSDTPQPLASL